MKVNRAYKVELKVNNKEKSRLLECCGLSRFVWNWGLGRRIEEYKKSGKNINSIGLSRELTQLKKYEFAWMSNYSRTIVTSSLRDLDQAYIKFWKEKRGFPKFKSKKKSKNSFRVCQSIHIKSDRIKLPRMDWLRLIEKGYIPTEGIKINSATVSERAGKWFVSVQVEEDIPEQANHTGETIGIDLGIKTLAVCSNGMTFKNPNALKKNLKKLRRIQKKFSRQKQGSENWNKTKIKLQRLHYHIAEIRRDTLHKATSEIVKAKPSKIVMENLNVSGMVKNRRLSRAISDVGMFEFKRQLKYKSEWNGTEFVLADRFFPSSKLCHVCGYKNVELKLSDRKWLCPSCNTEHDRDFNASKNLEYYESNNTGGLSGFQACGEDVRPAHRRQTSMKQEPSKRKRQKGTLF